MGKEEVLINLAQDFETLIVLDESRMRKIKQMDLRPELFTTNSEEGWIYVKSIIDLKNMDIEECNAEDPTIFIILTGWNDKYNRNLPYYFKVPYSSHSNYRELEKFVKAVTPKNLIYNVDDRAITKKRLEFQQYLMKEYVRKDYNMPSKSVCNDPLRGFFEDKTKILTIAKKNE